MGLILNIDTAVEAGMVSLGKHGKLLGFRTNDNQKDHAAWVQVAIRDVLQETGYGMHDVEAVAVSNGPGSYTGLRVSLSTAKGICFALKIPLITIGTLELMAESAIQQLSDDLLRSIDLLCPMIDARRMEVYAALYDKELSEIIKPAAIVLNGEIFGQLDAQSRILFFGNGSYKYKSSLLHPGAVFADYINAGALEMIRLSYQYFKNKRFSELAYTEPLYIKDFYSAAHKPSV